MEGLALPQGAARPNMGPPRDITGSICIATEALMVLANILPVLVSTAVLNEWNFQMADPGFPQEGLPTSLEGTLMSNPMIFKKKKMCQSKTIQTCRMERPMV